MSDAREEVQQTLRAINHAWFRGRPEDLHAHFHERMVIVFPGFAGRAEGRDACVRSYEDFRRQATLHEFHESDLSIDLFGNVSIATYRYEINYEMEGNSFGDTGGDLFVFIREAGRWLAVWRTLLPLPPAADDVKNESAD